MALSIDEINAVSSENFDKVLVQQAYDRSVFLKKIEKMGGFIKKEKGGVNLEFPIRYKRYDKAAKVGPRDQITFESAETRTAGTLYWSYLLGSTMMHWDESVKNAGKSQIVDLIADRSEELRDDMDYKLMTRLMSTDTPATDDIVPLPYIVDSANTYAGIAVADAANWAATEDSSTTTLKLFGSGSLAYMVAQTMFGTDAPTLHLTTRNLWNKYMSLLTPNQMYEDVDTANLGFSNVTFLKVPVVGDAYMTAAMWLGLDMSSFEIPVAGSDNGIEVSEWKDLFAAGFPNSLGKVIQWVGQVKCKRRRTNFKFSALDYTL